MRKVKYKKWIPREYEEDSLNVRRPVIDTNCFQAEFANSGLFHQWGNAYMESDAGFGNYTIALIEIDNGEIIEVLPSNIKFDDRPGYIEKDNFSLL